MFRDPDQSQGTRLVAVTVGRARGCHLEDPPPASPGHQGLSPWEGMSGAAVWADGRIIGVVAEHHSSEGTVG